MTAHLRRIFPALHDFSVTSSEDTGYNCIAWAAGRTTRWWWPHPDYYWPVELPTTGHVDAFLAGFSALGYEPCADSLLEDGFEKVAIYERHSQVTHMARQLRTGRWTSKIGDFEDIEHSSLSELEGDEYGIVVQYMRRHRRDEG